MKPRRMKIERIPPKEVGRGDDRGGKKRFDRAPVGGARPFKPVEGPSSDGPQRKEWKPRREFSAGPRSGTRSDVKPAFGARRPYGEGRPPQGTRRGFDRPKFAGPGPDRPKFDRPRFEKPGAEKRSFDKPRFEKRSFERPRFDKPGFDKPAGAPGAGPTSGFAERPKFEGRKPFAGAKRPFTGARPTSGSKRDFDRPRFDKPRQDKRGFEKRSFDGPRSDRPSFVKPAYGGAQRETSETRQDDTPRRPFRPQGDRPSFKPGGAGRPKPGFGGKPGGFGKSNRPSGFKRPNQAGGGAKRSGPRFGSRRPGGR